MDDRDLRALVVTACRILFREGHAALSGMAGHVSARDGTGAPSFVIKPVTVGFDEVGPEDLVAVDLDGRKIAGEHKLPGETAIHAGVYTAGPEVTCVIHTHPPFATALSCTEQALLPLTWTVGALGREVPVYDPGTLLIRTPEQGEALAEALGARGALLLKNHGVVVVGRTVAEATIRAVVLENAARLQWLARCFGGPTPLPEGAGYRLVEVYDAARFERMFAYAARSRAGAGG
jgi:L-fuculose-phosphate aldolase